MFSTSFLNELRRAELESVVDLLPTGCRVLDLGAGTGEQARILASRGYSVEAVDVEGGTYAEEQVFPVQTYDGQHLPFGDESFDVVYTSNVLEHIPATLLPTFHNEVRRVLRPDGIAFHVMPSHTWRAWTTATSVPDGIVQAVAMAGAPPREWYARCRSIGATVLPRRHGERGSILSEFWLYHPRWWHRHLESNGMVVSEVRPVGFFYTGNMLLGKALPMRHRNAIARGLGSAAYLYACRVR